MLLYRLCNRKRNYPIYTLRKKVQLGTLFVPYLDPREKGSQKGSLHVQEPKKVPYTGWPRKNGTVDTVDFQDFALINSYFLHFVG